MNKLAMWILYFTGTVFLAMGCVIADGYSLENGLRVVGMSLVIAAAVTGVLRLGSK